MLDCKVVRLMVTLLRMPLPQRGTPQRRSPPSSLIRYRWGCRRRSGNFDEYQFPNTTAAIWMSSSAMHCSSFIPKQRTRLSSCCSTKLRTRRWRHLIRGRQNCQHLGSRSSRLLKQRRRLSLPDGKNLSAAGNWATWLCSAIFAISSLAVSREMPLKMWPIGLATSAR